MKSFLRWSSALMMGGIVFASLQVATQPAFALPDEQVMERLRPVPVFTLTDERGAPLVSAPSEGQSGQSVAGVFISQQDAVNFLNGLRQNNAQLGAGVRVTPVSLAEVYELARTSEAGDANLRFQFVPMQSEVQTAQAILQESGQNQAQFNGVPLFVARSTQENGGYLSLQGEGGQEVMPIFFKREELQAMLTRLQQEQPDLANQMTIQVVTLEGLIETMRESNAPELTQILLVPPRETIEFIRSTQPQQGQQAPQAAPAAPR